MLKTSHSNQPTLPLYSQCSYPSNKNIYIINTMYGRLYKFKLISMY